MANAVDSRHRTESIPSFEVELAVSCSNLRDTDITSKSDPMCVLFVKEFGQQNWVERGRTEIIWNDLNPAFVSKFIMDYYFEEKQYLLFQVYDIDSKSPNLKDHTFLGEMECTLANVVCCMTVEQPLTEPNVKKSRDCGMIKVVCEKQMAASKEEICIGFEAMQLDKVQPLTNPSPYLLFQKENDDGSFTPVHRTEHVKKKTSPEWKVFNINMVTFCNGAYDRKLRISCFDWRNGGDVLIGETETTLRNLTRGPGPSNEFKLVNEKKKEKKREKYEHSGILRLQTISISSKYNFLDYIQGGGCEMKVMVAIDFTKSNGPPSDPSSLHHFVPGGPLNQYGRALSSVVEILEEYDSDKLIPAFGFGAKVSKGAAEASHLFALNGNKDCPDCAGMPGVLAAYYETLQRVTLHGPTCFAPAIKYAANEAAKYMNGSHYCILLILTDGIIDDMPETKQYIVRASKLPLSIIIIGIGNEDFTGMQILDGDHQRLSYKKETAARDIVQFVAFRDFDPLSLQSEVKSQLLLAKEVLHEVPDQVMGFMTSMKIKPKNISTPV